MAESSLNIVQIFSSTTEGGKCILKFPKKFSKVLPNLQRVETVRLGRVGRDCVEDVDQHQEEGHEERHPTLKDQVNRKLHMHMYVIRIYLLQYSPDGAQQCVPFFLFSLSCLGTLVHSVEIYFELVARDS